MLRSTVSRIRLMIVVLGCAVLGASLFFWAQSSRGDDAGVLWAATTAPSAAAGDGAEIWQAPASCARPYFVKAVLRAKAKLKALYDAAPEEVRAWRNRASPGAAPAPDQPGVYRLANGAPDPRIRNVAEYDATLHAHYAEWYATVAKLEIQESRWEQRLLNVADQKIMLGEAARRNFKSGDAGVPGANGDFEHYVLFLLGLGGFPADEELALKADCVTIVPVRQVLTTAPSGGALWRWPLDHPAAVALGLELVLIGLIFVPIKLWLSTGDLAAAKRQVRDQAVRLAAAVRSLRRTKFVADVVGIIRAGSAAARRRLKAMIKSWPATALAQRWNHK